MNDRLLNVLVAEDNEDHLELIVFGLKSARSCGRVQTVFDGESALSVLRREGAHANVERPDLVMLDMHMPKLGGLEVLEAIKSDPQLKHLPVVMLTTSSDEKDRLAAYQRNANSYLVKPFDYEAFREMIACVAQYWGRWNQPAPRD